MKRKGVVFTAVLLVTLLGAALGMTAFADTGEPAPAAPAPAGSKVLELSIDFGENYDQAAHRYINQKFAKHQGAERKAFAAGDVISYEIYSPDVDAGGFDGSIFKPLDAAPWAEGWGFLRTEAAWKDAADASVHSTWAIATKDKDGFTKRTLTLKEGADAIGKVMDFWSVAFETNAAMPKRNISIYYRNWTVTDADGNLKTVVFNNSSLHTLVEGAWDTSGVTSAEVNVVDDPFAAALPEYSRDRVIKMTVDLGADFATAKAREANLIMLSIPGGSELSAGDYIEYDIYSTAASSTEVFFDGQFSDTNWTAVMASGGLRELNQYGVSTSWTALKYDSSNGSVSAADFSSGWFTRKLIVEPGSAFIGKAVYHHSLHFASSAAFTSRYVDIYVRNVAIRSVDNSVVYNVFDGSQMANAVPGGVLGMYTLPSPTVCDAALSVVNDPLGAVEYKRPTRGQEDKYISVKLQNNEGTEKTFTASVLPADRTHAVANGDKLVYDFTMPEAAKGLGNIDLLFSDGTKMSAAQLKDTYGNDVAASTGYGTLAVKNIYTNAWLTRTIDLSGFAGKTVEKVLVSVELPQAAAAASYAFEIGKISIVNGAAEDVLYGAAGKGFDQSAVSKIDGTLDGIVAEEPVFVPETAPEEYVTFTYTLDDKTADVNRFIKLSLFGYGSNSVILNAGDRIYYDIMVDKILPGSSLAQYDFQINGGSWTTLGAQNVIDQRGLQTEDNSFVTAANTWYTKYFDIELEALNFPIGHHIVAAAINGVQTEDEVSVSIGNLYVLKVDGRRMDIIGNGRTVFQGSVDRFGQANEYKSGMDVKSITTTGYTAPTQSAPSKYIEADLTVAGLATGSVASRELYYSLFGAEFTDYEFKAGDVFSYDINISGPLSGLGMLDFQVVKEGAEYHGKFMRDLTTAAFAAGTPIKDQYGIDYLPNSDISSIAYGGWATRTVEVPNDFVGYKIQHIVLTLNNSSWLQGFQFTDADDDLVRLIKVMVGNITVKHSDNTSTVIFGAGSDLEFDAEKAWTLDSAGDVMFKFMRSNKAAPTAVKPAGFDKKSPADIAVTVDLKDISLVSLKLGNAVVATDNYTLSADNGTLTLAKDYLADLDVGTYTFTITTADGTADFELSVTEKASGGCKSSAAAGGMSLLVMLFAAIIVKSKRS